ncbi:sugar transporter [Tateyamaria sp. SN6-1]|uniref:sugar transporter n=1 Tax=Tateyamaria sp. SN6-1 TaxID=3092148 RepID=UPI0039F59EE8
MRTRHKAIIASFILVVLMPLIAFGFYLWTVAEDRYASTVGFTVRQEEGQSGADLIGGLAALTGGAPSTDSDVLYEFIRSQQLVRRIDARLGLREYYSQYWEADPVFAIWPDASIEDLLWYWGRVVRVSYDQGTGLTELRILAFDPAMAQAIAAEVVAESQAMVNALNEQARSDAIRYADIELKQAEDRLRDARAALTDFRTRTQIVDLSADIEARMGVVSNLQQQLATELVAFDELAVTTNTDDPRVTQATRRIAVIRDRIAEERRSFATTEVLGTGEDYPTLISEFEGLSVEREFAEEAFRAALAARDTARANAVRQSRYLATYVRPTLAERSEYPQRPMLMALAALFSVLVWGITVMVYYSIRDKA